MLWLNKNRKILKKKCLNIEEKKKEFMEAYAQIFQEVGVATDTEIAWRLLNWEHSGEVMMLLNSSTDWNSVDELLHNQGHTFLLVRTILFFNTTNLSRVYVVFIICLNLLFVR